MPWALVRGAEVTLTKGRAYLEFDYPAGHERFCVDHLEKSEEEIRALIAAYQEQHARTERLEGRQRGGR